VSSYDVVILGAGPAGLGAAYQLARAGRAVCVLERERVVGGLAASFEVAGLRVDHGSHRLHPTTPPPVMATLRSLLGDDLQERPRHGRIRMAGRSVTFPPRPVDLLAHLPPRLSARLAFDLATSPLRRRDRAADTFSDVVRASFGSTMTDRFYAPYVEKLFGARASELSGELARRRVGTRTARDLVRRVLRPAPERGIFFYPRRGYGQISESLATAAAGAGAQIELERVVASVRRGDDQFVVGTGDGAQFDAANVWSTLPLALLARLGDAPEPVAAAASTLETRALVLVYLVLATGQWTPFDAHYFPELDVPMARLSEPKNYRTSRDDPDDVTVLCAEVPCSIGDDVWQADAGTLGDLVVDALSRSELPRPDVIHVEVKRVPRAYPVYRVGYESAFETVDAWATRVPGLTHFGRQGLFAHDNTHHALAMAWAAADAYSGGAVDARVWSEARERFATHVVED
jgi:protoporphyrinogen oxidase